MIAIPVDADTVRDLLALNEKLRDTLSRQRCSQCDAPYGAPDEERTYPDCTRCAETRQMLKDSIADRTR